MIPENNELVQLEMTGQRNRFLADAFHQAAVAGDDIGVMIDEVITEMRIHDALGQRHAHGVGKPLPQRTRRRFDTGGVAVFRMTGRPRTELAEILDFFDGHVFVAGEVQQRIEQHRTMTGGKHETIAVRPVRSLGIEFEEAGIEHGRNVSCAHGKTRVTGIGFFHCFRRQEADCIGHLVGFFRIGHGYRLSRDEEMPFLEAGQTKSKRHATHSRCHHGVNKT